MSRETQNTISLPFKPQHSEEWLNTYLNKHYSNKSYDRFKWWRKYTPKKKPLPNRVPLRDKITNGDFDMGPYKFEAELVEHTINAKYLEYYNDQGRYLEQTSVDKARRKRLLEDFEKSENDLLDSLAKQFKDISGIKKEKILDLLQDFDGTLAEFYIEFATKYCKAVYL